MKRILYIWCVFLGLTACDHIAEDNRLIYEAPPVVNRSVLIEDFTGQRCVNCPNAADEIHKLQQEYGEDVVIAVGIHGGPLSVENNPERNIVGLATETGDNYNSYWNIEQWPMGMVNRGGVCPYTDWKARVREELAKEAPVSLGVDFRFDDSGKDLIARVVVEGTVGHVDGKMQLWVVENNITAIQLMPDGNANTDYVHQHVFRTAVNGEWGEDISLNEGESLKKDYSFSPADLWNSDNLALVVFVYNNQGVMQVVCQPLQTIR